LTGFGELCGNFKSFSILERFSASSEVENNEHGRERLTHGILRKSTISESEVRVNIAVIWVRPPFSFLAFDPFDGSTTSPQVMDNSISTGFFPPFECTSTSFIAAIYWGSSLTEARTSCPNGDRRLRSYDQMSVTDDEGQGKMLPFRSYTVLAFLKVREK
jgi:hypothetical protein